MTSGKRSRQRKSTARRHHVVPKVYLEAWADHGRVLVVRKATGDKFVASLDNVAVEKNFYMLFLPDGSESADVEESMSLIEGEAKAALGSVRSGTWPLSSEHRVALARLIALQIGRTPAVRDVFNRMIDRALEISIQARTRMAELKATDPEQYQRISDAQTRLSSLHEEPSASATELAAGRWSLPLHTLAGTEQLAEMARQQTWTLLEATEGVFSTCDQPVTFWPHFTDSFPQPVGLLTAERTTFPLSPGLTLQIRTPTEEELELPTDERQHRRTVDLDELYWMNAMVTEHAHSNVIVPVGVQPGDIAPTELAAAERIARRVVEQSQG